ncbi:short-chain dehydrogenase [Pseudomonas sp. HAR-UPW-AIA-41]|uniref:SDR family oxidoreductase n=1 Tax=Pseudomonas sp. HAR-UPW-AIA-41 TaxID=1985301 RepID=UPI000BB37FBD|nr:SDR family oxidoreductase [Pseudomonas sp. HAR-UPW-AIA-41]PAV49110.1 short-chain dehydrogenase [Pseudomonas sp. HAR-UPW-AIA-41]
MSQPVAFITGCSSGIGRALADAFQAAGYRVWACARKAQDLATLSAAGFVAVELDVNDAAAVQRASARLEQEVGRLDVLINNAGYGAMGPLLDGGAEALRRQFETNVFSLIELTRACFPLLRASRGLVVNIGSVSGVMVTPFAGAYCASKAAVHALSDALRMELAPFAIEVMEVQPGAIASSFGSNASREAEALIAESSAWWPLREGIRARANASQDHPTPASEFAAVLLAAVQQRKRPRLLRIGNGSRALPLLTALLPKALLEKVLMKRFGLNRQLAP